MTQPYYEQDGITIYHGDALDLFPMESDVLVTDPPYGIRYASNRPRIVGNARGILGDGSTELRDLLLFRWVGPALVFGSHKTPRPEGTRQVLVWDQDGALGMGDLSIPWKPSWQEIYVIGGPWAGRRDCGSVLRCPPVQSVGRAHPHQKPVPLIKMLLTKCVPGTVIDPCMGAGSVLVAAKEVARKAIGIEIEERYCEIAANRLQQSVLSLEGVA